MQETINMEVIPQGGNKYTVVMDKKDIKVRKCTCCCASRIIIAVLIAACLGFSIFVFVSMKNCEITVNETTTFALDYDKNPAMPITNGKKATPATDDTNLDNNRKRHRSPYHGKVVQEKTNMYPIFCMAYFVVLAGTIAALIVLFIKDDSCFRCTKLDELREIKENLLKGDFKNSKDETVEKNHSEETSVNYNTVKKTNKNTKTETTDNRAALLRHYMDCVAEL